MSTGIYILIFLGIVLIATIVRYIKSHSGSYDTYLIKKGKHYSLRNGSIIPYKFGLAPKTLRFAVLFGEGCDYQDQSGGDINKLYGISYGFNNHKNSVRIGWRYNDNLKTIELFSYYYANGMRKYKFLTCVALYDELKYTIFKGVRDTMIIEIENEAGKIVAQEEIEGIKTGWLRLKQFPYYGGDTLPVQNMKIFIKDIH